MKEFSVELKNLLLNCNSCYRAIIATLECNVHGLSNNEKLARIENFITTGNIEDLSVKSACRLEELNKEFSGDAEKLVLYLIEGLEATS